MAHKGKQKWKQSTLRMKDNHRWNATPGHKIIVLDKGALRFNYPEKWVVVPEEHSINLYDKQPPKDDCRLAVSYLRLPTLDWSELPLSQLIDVASAGTDDRPTQSRGELVTEPRSDVELAWVQVTFDDPVEHRDAYTRIAIARGFNLQALVTLDFWPEDAPRLESVWKEVMRSIELGRYVVDPTVGDVLQ